MPDQPEDAIHYDMKIPPEPDPPKPAEKSDGAEKHDAAENDDAARNQGTQSGRGGPKAGPGGK